MTIEYREDDATRTAEVLVRGKITMEDYTAAVEPMQAFIDRHGTVKFIEVIESFFRFRPGCALAGNKIRLAKYKPDQPCCGRVRPWLGGTTLKGCWCAYLITSPVLSVGRVERGPRMDSAGLA